MTNSSRSGSQKRAHKFPLYQHAGTGYWCKTIRGKRHYFGKVEGDAKGTKALELYLKEKDYLAIGQVPPTRVGIVTVEYLCDNWLKLKADKLESGELAQRSYDEYAATAELIKKNLGKTRDANSITPDEFAAFRKTLAKRYGPNPLSKRIIQTRSVFKHGRQSKLISEPSFGPGFSVPSAKTLRKHRLEKGRLDYSADEIRALLTVARPNARAFILLGIQAGFGNTDCAELEVSDVDLENGWIEYAREKTQTFRRIPLWPETVAALKEAIASRKVESNLVFIGPRGQPYTDEQRTGHRVGGAYRQTVKDAGITDKGFYSLRRSFQTISENARDLTATKAIMGHVDAQTDMSARYRQVISDHRLRDVVECVRQWLLPIPDSKPKGRVTA